LENAIKSALDAYSAHDPVGAWARSILGIGPVIAAGLLAHIDIEKAPTAGHIWRYAGLDPTSVWSKGTKRPWNASLKVLCYKIGESFVKVHNNERDVYGHIYAERKAFEIARNESGAFADQAAAKLKAFKIGKDTQARTHYEAGRLPPAHIHARARRYAVKLFLAHLQEVMFWHRYGERAPKPYILTKPEHVHYLAPPNAPWD
jgi:Transposase IS116/IS110/IS902 family